MTAGKERDPIGEKPRRRSPFLSSRASPTRILYLLLIFLPSFRSFFLPSSFSSPSFLIPSFRRIRLPPRRSDLTPGPRSLSSLLGSSSSPSPAAASAASAASASASASDAASAVAAASADSTTATPADWADDSPEALAKSLAARSASEGPSEVCRAVGEFLAKGAYAPWVRDHIVQASQSGREEILIGGEKNKNKKYNRQIRAMTGPSAGLRPSPPSCRLLPPACSSPFPHAPIAPVSSLDY